MNTSRGKERITKAIYISKCHDILLIPGNIPHFVHPIFGSGRSRGCRALGELWTAPLGDAQGARLPFLAKHDEFTGKKRVDFTEKTVDLNGFHLQTLGIWRAYESPNGMEISEI